MTCPHIINRESLVSATLQAPNDERISHAISRIPFEFHLLLNTINHRLLDECGFVIGNIVLEFATPIEMVARVIAEPCPISDASGARYEWEWVCDGTESLMPHAVPFVTLEEYKARP